MVDFVLGRVKINWAGEWAEDANYIKNDVISYGAKSYICTNTHTSSSNTAGGFYIDVVNKWEQLSDGMSFKGTWTPETAYKIGDIVLLNGLSWITTVGHISGTNFVDSEEYLTLMTQGLNYVGEYNSATYYYPNDIVTYGGRLYIAMTGTENNTPSDEADWTLFSARTKYRGLYSPEASYKVGDVVIQGGSAYVAKVDDDAGLNSPNVNSNTYWQIVTTGFQWLGSYDSEETYNYGDVVRYQGTAWISRTDINANNVPTSNSVWWGVMATDSNAELVLTSTGDVPYQSANSVITRLPIGSSGTVLKVSGNRPSWASIQLSKSAPFILSESNSLNHGAIKTTVERNDSLYGFSSSGPYTTFYAYGLGNYNPSTIQAFNIVCGDGYPGGTSGPMYTAAGSSFSSRKLVTPTAARLGTNYRSYWWRGSSGYSPMTLMLWPLRNTTGSAITQTFNWMYSGQNSSGYDGSSVAYFVPNSTTYSGTNAGYWYNAFSSQTNTSGSETSFSITVPANKTILIMSCVTMYNPGYQFMSMYTGYEANMFYNLNNLDSGLVTDFRILGTALHANFMSTGTYNQFNDYLLYNKTAELYGDR